MSDLPKCRLCGSDAQHLQSSDSYSCPNLSCNADTLVVTESEWRTLMTQQQAEPSQVPTGHVYLPEITPEMWETLGDTDVMTWIDGPQWTQIAVDFASMLPVKMPPQPAPIPTAERLPTDSDFDCRGQIWCYFCDIAEWQIVSRDGDGEAYKFSDYWLPTGMKMPPAPGGSDE